MSLTRQNQVVPTTVIVPSSFSAQHLPGDSEKGISQKSQTVLDHDAPALASSNGPRDASSSQNRFILWLQNTKPMDWPGVNFVTQFFLYVPGEKDMQRLLNFFGLVGALVLTLSVALLTGTVDAQELEAADKRFLTPGTGYYTYWHTPRVGGARTVDTYSPPSKVFVLYGALSVVMLALEVLLILIMAVSLTLFHLGQTRLRDDMSEDERRVVMAQQDIERAAWYKWNRYVALIGVSMLLAGILLFFVAVYFLLVIKVPDYFVEAHGRKQLDSVYGFTEGMIWAVMIVFVISTLLSGFGARASALKREEFKSAS